MAKNYKKEVGLIPRKNGASFRVWAPFAKSVELSGTFNGWGRQPMDSENDGYWHCDVDSALPGQEYKFIIHTDNGEMYKNDPRSLQLATAGGNSLVVDNSFEWGNDEFRLPDRNQQVIYEMHIGTFNRSDPAIVGSFSDAAAKLDYLAELGVNLIEVMPVGTMPMDRGWGYAADYIYSVESLYGGRREFMQFVKAAHNRGIGVILDVVYNHFGPDDQLDLWQFDGWNQDGKGGIYFYNDWRSKTPWGDTRPDYGRLEVRQYILDNVRMWLTDFHLDGLRVDSTIYIRTVDGHNNDPGNDIPEGWSLLQDITSLSRKIKPDSLSIAEDIGGNEYITKPAGEGGAGFSTQWEVGFPHALRAALDAVEDGHRNLQSVIDILNRKYNGDAFQRVVYSDSHDSAANGGARLVEEISPGRPTSIYARRRALLAASIVLTAPGIPMLFQGQEFMQGGNFNDWQVLDWKNTEKFAGIVEAHRHLIALRKNRYGNSRGLSGQSINTLHLNDGDKVVAYHRWDQGGPGDDVIIVINFSNRTFKDYRFTFPRPGVWKVRFNSDYKGYSPEFKNIETGDVNVETDTGSVNLAPYSALILSQD